MLAEPPRHVVPGAVPCFTCPSSPGTGSKPASARADPSHTQRTAPADTAGAVMSAEPYCQRGRFPALPRPPGQRPLLTYWAGCHDADEMSTNLSRSTRPPYLDVADGAGQTRRQARMFAAGRPTGPDRAQAPQSPWGAVCIAEKAADPGDSWTRPTPKRRPGPVSNRGPGRARAPNPSRMPTRHSQRVPAVADRQVGAAPPVRISHRVGRSSPRLVGRCAGGAARPRTPGTRTRHPSGVGEAARLPQFGVWRRGHSRDVVPWDGHGADLRIGPTRGRSNFTDPTGSTL